MAVKGKRKAEIELTLLDRTSAALHGAKRNLLKFASSTPKSIAKGAGRASMAIGKSLMMGFGMRGADMMVDAFGGIVDVERELTRFQIASSSSDEAMQKFRGSLLDVSNSAGISRAEVLRGAAAYIAFTGDSAGATDSMALFAEVANATGASMADITGVAGSFLKNLKLNPEQFRQGFDILTTQGKQGAVEIKDLASELSNVAPMFSKFAGGSGIDGLAKMGSIMQAMRTDFGGVEETATGFKSVMSSIIKHHDRLKDKGIQVFGKDKNPRAFLAIVDDIGKKVRNGKLNQADLIDLLGEQKAVNALNAVISKRKDVEDMANNARQSNAIAKDSATYQLSTAGRLDKAWTNIKNKIAEALTPERINSMASALIKVADVFAKLVDRISAIIGFIADHLPSYEGARTDASTDISKKLDSNREQRIQQLMEGRGAATPGELSDQAGGNWRWQDGGKAPAPMSRDEAIKTLMAQARQVQSLVMRNNENGTINAHGADVGSMDAFAEDSFKLSRMLNPQRKNMVTERRMADDASMATAFMKPAPMSFADSAASSRSAMAAPKEYPVFNVTLKIGEATFAKAMANDPTQRRKPGGFM
jgi:TP901 family phage tail tape measure protein